MLRIFISIQEFFYSNLSGNFNSSLKCYYITKLCYYYPSDINFCKNVWNFLIIPVTKRISDNKIL